MIEILHYLRDPRLWELWYIPYYGSAGQPYLSGTARHVLAIHMPLARRPTCMHTYIEKPKP